ncbi:hypothetical protein [Aliikangiella sp. IMCC44359]|uniref:hypothetical protein n=1 Tax=Aliikangiella sp. IMCC44359 TaxID=3459125 RepID=UPI00403AB997
MRTLNLNPNYLFNNSKFEDFLKSVETLNISAHIKTPYTRTNLPKATANEEQANTSNCKISDTFRLFRIGEFSDNLETKFTSCWTSLKSLTRDTYPDIKGTT